MSVFPDWAEYAGFGVGAAIDLREDGALGAFNLRITETAGVSYVVDSDQLDGGVFYICATRPEKFEIYHMCAIDVGLPIVEWGE